MFKRNKIRPIPVVAEDVIIAMPSYSDLLRISFVDAVDENEKDVDTLVYNMFSIEQVMVKNVTTVNSNTIVKKAAQILADQECCVLSVIKNGLLIGIVTTTDLIKYMLQFI